MRPRRLLLALLLVASLGVPADARAQTMPRDDTGLPTGACAYLDDSVTPNLYQRCSTTHPLPMSPGSASIATDTLGYGRSFFLSNSGSGTVSTSRLSTILFLDDIDVVGWGITGGSTLATASSVDGGRTWGALGTVGFGTAINAPIHAGRTIGTAPRFLLSVSGIAGSPTILNSTSAAGGWAASTFGTGINNNSGPTFAIQGATVMVWGQGGAANNTAVACRSQDNGQTFQNCVTVDATNNTGFTSTSGPHQTITSPAAGTWLAVANNGKVWRSTDDGATWATVVTLAGGAASPIKCVSATVCVTTGAGTGGIAPYRSTDGGATWTQQATIVNPSVGAGKALCLYGNNVLDVIASDNFPSTATTTSTGAARSVDGGQTWLPVTVTGGLAAFSGANFDVVSDCTSTATGRSAFIGFRTASTGLYYGPTTSNTVQIVGANGIPLNVDGNGNFTGNQGLPQATSPNAWGVVPVQGASLKNSQQTSAVTTAQTITIAAVTSQRVHLRRIDASCNTAAATAPTLTVTDGATQIWALAATETVAAGARTVVTWSPSLDSTTGQAMAITLGACTAGTSLLSVQADQF